MPEFLNLTHACCERWEHDKNHLALIYEHADSSVERYTYAELDDSASRFAYVLKACGLQRDERVAVLLSQQPETTLTHLASRKLGLVSSPTSVLFGTDALVYRLTDSGARVMVTGSDNIDKVRVIRAQSARLEPVVLIDDASTDADNFRRVQEHASPDCRAVQTRADDPAWISYTSGTTGAPESALQPHRLLLGVLPSLECVWDAFPRPDDVTWSPADWSWMGGFAGVMLPSLWHGCTTVGTSLGGFNPENAFRMLSAYGVTRTLLVPTIAGYRIGPAEIEEALLGHPAVQNVAVIAVPDALRAEVIKAFVVLATGFVGNDELIAQLQDHVRTRLARREVPRHIEFIGALPMTTTHKILRRELRARERSKIAPG